MSSFWDYPEEVRETPKDSFENILELRKKRKRIEIIFF
jgi:hypothetical protein